MSCNNNSKKSVKSIRVSVYRITHSFVDLSYLFYDFNVYLQYIRARILHCLNNTYLLVFPQSQSIYINKTHGYCILLHLIFLSWRWEKKSIVYCTGTRIIEHFFSTRDFETKKERYGSLQSHSHSESKCFLLRPRHQARLKQEFHLSDSWQMERAEKGLIKVHACTRTMFSE